MKYLLLGLFWLTYLFSPAQTAEEICPKPIGTQIADTQLRTAAGESVSSSSLLDDKYTVLIFYRGGWCPYCNKHMKGLRKIEGQLTEAGYQIVAISPDKPDEISKSLSKHKMGYSLLSDSKLALTSSLGLDFQVDEKTIKKYKMYGINLEKSSGESHKRLPVPAVLLINPDREIIFSYVNPTYKVRMDEELIVTVAKALKGKK